MPVIAKAETSTVWLPTFTDSSRTLIARNVAGKKPSQINGRSMQPEVISGAADD